MKKIVIITVLSVIFLVIGVAGSIAGYIYLNLQPVASPEEAREVIVNIPPGTSSREIGRLLEDKNLIRNANFFTYYLKYYHIGDKLQAGEYQLRTDQTIETITKKLQEGKVYKETFSFTIPEGYTVKQIADRLAEQQLINRETFLKEVNEGSFSYDFVKNIPESPEIKYRLEGYLFPETYELEKGATEHEIIDRMLSQFNQEFQQEWKEELVKKNLTLHEVVTMASIVEREVQSDKERAQVAGVYYNRLAIDMLLQADATIQYIFGKQKEIVTYDDLEIDDPYNTYQSPGLPPGPIANPGREALKSAVYPEEHEYFYYVTKKDGSGEHYFAKTFPEHQRNITKSKQNEKK